MPTLRDSFPRTSAGHPQAASWTAPFTWSTRDAANLIFHLSRTQGELMAVSHVEAMAFSEALRADIAAATATATDHETRANIDGARFVLSMMPIQETLRHGELGDCFGWTLGALSGDHNPASRINTADYRLPPYDGASIWMNNLALGNLLLWADWAYILAVKFGGLDENCRLFLDYCVRHAISQLSQDQELALDALSAMTIWAARSEHPMAEVLTAILLDAYERLPMSPRSRVRLGVAFTTAAHRWTPLSAPAWARRLLAEHRSELTEHLLVQVMAVAVDTPEAWAEHREMLLIEVRRLASYYQALAAPGSDTLLALESRIGILHPLFYGLTTFGTTEDVMAVLWAWYGTATGEVADANILFVSSAYRGGCAFVWPGGRLLPPGQGGETLEGIQTAVSDALTEYYRGPAGDRFPVFDEVRAGAPVLDQGPALERAVAAHYRPDELRRALPSGFEPRALVVVPAQRDPFQAVLARECGRLTPLEASLANPRPDRRIRKVSIWPGETYHTDAEIAVIRAAAARADWTVEVAGPALDEAALRAFYEDIDADVLWIIGHGEQSPYHLEETGLELSDRSIVPVTVWRGWLAPQGDRRLLVLNICSGAATQNRGGMARFGLGHALASPSQQIVAHLWPIAHLSGLAFGAALAAGLVTRDARGATEQALGLLRDPEALRAAIAVLSPELEALERLSTPEAATGLTNILSWGCPVLLT